MKKLVSILLVLTMIFCTATVAFATTEGYTKDGEKIVIDAENEAGKDVTDYVTATELGSSDSVVKAIKAAKTAEKYVESIDMEDEVDKVISDYKIATVYEFEGTKSGTKDGRASATNEVTVEFYVDGVKKTDTVVLLVKTGTKTWEVLETTTGRSKVTATFDYFGTTVILVGEEPDYVSPVRFNDVYTTDWFYNAVTFCVDKGLMNGMSTYYFQPNVTTTRAMVALMLYRLAGSPYYNGACPFTDVTDATYTKAIAWAFKNGIVDGYSATRFGPNDVVTREQLVTMIYRYEKYTGGGYVGSWMYQLPFDDVAKVSSWASEAMHWCYMNGIVSGRLNTATGKTLLEPTGTSTRAELAQVFYNYAK